jgi:hypothetical protein
MQLNAKEVSYYSGESLYSAKFVCKDQEDWTKIQENAQLISDSCTSYFQYVYELGNQILVIENGTKTHFSRDFFLSHNSTPESLIPTHEGKLASRSTRQYVIAGVEGGRSSPSTQPIEVYKERYFLTNEFPVRLYYDSELDRTIYAYSIPRSCSNLAPLLKQKATVFFIYDVNMTNKPHGEHEIKKEFKIDVKALNLDDVNLLIDLLFTT